MRYSNRGWIWRPKEGGFWCAKPPAQVLGAVVMNTLSELSDGVWCGHGQPTLVGSLRLQLKKNGRLSEKEWMVADSPATAADLEWTVVHSVADCFRDGKETNHTKLHAQGKYLPPSLARTSVKALKMTEMTPHVVPTRVLFARAAKRHKQQSNACPDSHVYGGASKSQTEGRGKKGQDSDHHP